jgi:hypothetical protein
MSGQLVVISPDGAHTIVRYETREPPLTLLQHHCGGYVQQIPAVVTYDGQKCPCFADEEGKLKNRPVNENASRLCQPHLIVGNLVIDVRDRKVRGAGNGH